MEKKITFEVIRSSRKTIAIEIKPDATVLVRAPLKMKDAEIQKFVKAKENWILTHLENAKERQKESENAEKLSPEEIRKLADLALKVIPVKVNHYAGLMKVRYGRITIRNQKTRWGKLQQQRKSEF